MAQQGTVPGSERKSGALDVLHRAHSLEQQGRVHEACDVLEQFVDSAWPWSRAALEEARTSSGGALCPSAMVLLNERRGRLFRQRAVRRAVGMSCFALAYLAFAVFATHQGLRGSPWWFLGTALGVPTVPLLVLGSLWSLWHRNAWRTPRWATVQRLTVLPEGSESGAPTCIAELALDSEPSQLRRLTFAQGLTVEPGMRLLVAVQGSSVRFLP